MDSYADAAERVAAVELDMTVARAEPARTAEAVITGMIVGVSLLNALRRLAQQDASARRPLSGGGSTPSRLDGLIPGRHSRTRPRVA